jgi:hypothetical protein
VRQRIEARTGRTLEESYEGFTNLVADAVEAVFRDDSRPAKKRNSPGTWMR